MARPRSTSARRTQSGGEAQVDDLSPNPIGARADDAHDALAREAADLGERRGHGADVGLGVAERRLVRLPAVGAEEQGVAADLGLRARRREQGEEPGERGEGPATGASSGDLPATHAGLSGASAPLPRAPP
jgi:hypothetical protein